MSFIEGRSEMAKSVDSALMGELWRQNFGAPGGLTDPGSLSLKWEGAHAGALQDYEQLMGGAESIAPRPATTLRAVSAPPSAMPQESYGVRKGVPGGGAGKGIDPGTGLPTYDTGAVESLAQRFAAPGIRNLRNTVQEVQQGVYDNPNVKRMTIRDALAGYGQGLESTMAGALGTASNIYGQEYGPQVQGALQARSIGSAEKMHSESIASNERMAELNNQWRAWLASQR